MPELTPLHPRHHDAVLDLEVTNRASFARTVSDRGDQYFAEFSDRFEALLQEQRDGTCAFYVLLDEDGSVLGRFNLVDLAEGCAEVGFRVARKVAGQGVATAGVRDLCRLAATRHGLHTVRAAVSHANPASRRVLLKAGFVAVGPADPGHLGGKDGTWHERRLTPTPT
ncbi:GNAT family N-acetyltransferase [Ornithinimicrobium cavernae]|uniref:GNAT family N-acetyltransferase n=1 Tax=Ornithinimicrobium cavernae TaxID=2666047 RepID=UPI000D68FE99|nr:GNAT family N-acetyltransferase [Ornithinimicrobium cavernae]